MRIWKLFKDIKKIIKGKLNPTYPTFRKLIEASWNDKEEAELDKLGFEYCTLKIDSENKIIELEKFYDEEVVGYADNVYGVNIYSEITKQNSHRSFEDFDKLIEYLKDNIPEVDLNVKNYNI